MEVALSNPLVGPFKMFILLALTRRLSGNTSCSKVTC